jgi:hypothetical protein
MMQATVQVEQTLPDGSHIMGTGFLVNDPTPDGRAAHGAGHRQSRVRAA